MRFIGWLLSNAVALAVAAWLIDGIKFTGPTQGMEEVKHKLLPLLGVALILGIVSALVKPVLTILSLPVVILTLGLFLLVINAAMLLLTGWLAGKLGIGFEVTGFWPAVGGAIVITIVEWFVDKVFDQ
ncbi:phage holin family protein [Nocardioides sp. CER19]|uniref:phage holin family protein n=1 Tax=Nocardioides sp. CER19 TaxID=3038538 RepID=UPI00244CDBE9|nr:phage holin family protein [Nocardioides sp. CER19]MDH2413151.1 phage holin family protein [Nocardioides sp. CER19]